MVSLTTASGVELVALASEREAPFKEVGAELQRRPCDPSAAEALVVAHRDGRMAPWLVAYLLGCVRAPIGYDAAREILVTASGQLAESYAGPAMARIAGAAAHDDLADLMMTASRLRSREGAAYGLAVLAREDTAEWMLRATKAGKIRRATAAHIVAMFPDPMATLLDWLGRDDPDIEALGVAASSIFLTVNAGLPDSALCLAIRRTLDAGRVTLAPRSRNALLQRIAPALHGDPSSPR